MVRKVTKISSNNILKSPEGKIKVAAYCRVSTDNDEQLLSLEAQRIHYESYIKSNPKWEYVGIYYDEGISGTKKENRTGLMQLIEDCENKKIDFIITKSISRLVRNTTDCLEIVRKLTDIGVYIYFEKENINTKSMGSELMITILSSLAENESLSISENNKWTIQKRFKSGTYKISYPPYGYYYENGNIKVNEEQALIVKRIFFEALEGKGTTKIANGLNSDGIPPRKGSKWHSSTINNILTNEKYTGDALLQKTYTDGHFKRHKNKGEKEQYFIENHHEAIISRDVFLAVSKLLEQRRLDKNIKKGSTKYQNRYVFSGKIKCSECGNTFRRRIHYSGSPNEYAAWCCVKHIENPSECSMRFIKEDDIFKAFVIMMNKLIYGNKYILRPLLRTLKETDYSKNMLELEELDHKIEINADRLQVLNNLLAKGFLEHSMFIAESNDIKKEETMLKEQKKLLINSLKGNMAVFYETERLLKWVSKSDYIKEFDEAAFENFVDRIIIYSQEEIGFMMKCNITLKERMVG